MAALLIVPGYQNAGPGHWQSLWEAGLGHAVRVEMPNGALPHRAAWVEALEEAIAACSEPPLLAGHGLGCLTIVHWAARHGREVRGALLAAPADADRPGASAAERAFAPVPRLRLAFPAILAASSNDPALGLDRARALATDWGARFVDLGPCGGLDQASGHGPWPRGEALLAELR